MSQYNKIITAINTVTEDYEFIPNDNCIVIDTSNNRIGINTTDPLHNIDISGTDGTIKTSIVKCNQILPEGANAKIGLDEPFNNIISENLTIAHRDQTGSVLTKYINLTADGEIRLNANVFVDGSFNSTSRSVTISTSDNIIGRLVTQSILSSNEVINKTPIGFRYISGDLVPLKYDICSNFMEHARFLKLYTHDDVCFNQIVNISGDLLVEYGQSTLSGGLIVNTNAEFNCDTSFNYNVEVTNHLLVKDASFSNIVEISNHLIVIGDSSLNNVDISQNLIVLGDSNFSNVDISQNLLVLRDSNFSKVDISQNLLVLGDASFNSNVEISQNLLVLGDSSFSNIDISQNLLVLGDCSFTNVDISQNLTVNGDTSLNGNLTISGSIGLGATPEFGTSGLFLMSTGASTPPVWNNIPLPTYTNGQEINLYGSGEHRARLRTLTQGNDMYTEIQGLGSNGDYNRLHLRGYNVITLETIPDDYYTVIRGVFLTGTYVTVNGTFVNNSDDLLKDNERPITNVYDKISSLNVQQYTKYTYDPASYERTGYGKHEYGVIAQDLLDTDLSFVAVKPSDSQYYSVAYQNLFCLNLEGTKQLIQQVTSQARTIQDQSAIIIQQQQEINNLKNENSLIKTTLNRLLTDLSYTYQI